jgi:hypothetical protein
VGKNPVVPGLRPFDPEQLRTTTLMWSVNSENPSDNRSVKDCNNDRKRRELR